MTKHARKALLLALNVMTCAAASAQVYKCPDPHGRTVMQQAPCTGGEEVRVRPSTGFDNPRNAAASDQPGSGPNQAILSGIAKGRPVIGMSEQNLRMAMGEPVRINEDNYNGRQRDQWIYERSDGTWYVYVSDGVVRSTQFRNYPNVRTKERKCPSDMDIRNLETSANSVTISEQRKRELQREVAAAKACR